MAPIVAAVRPSVSRTASAEPHRRNRSADGHDSTSRYRPDRYSYAPTLTRGTSGTGRSSALAGTPAASVIGGICVPPVTTAPAAITAPRPTTAPFITTAPIPTSTSSSIVQPCSTTRWPTVTRSPITTGEPGSVCTTDRSWMLDEAPIVIGSTSARSTQPYQTDDFAASVTLPATTAVEARNASSAMVGVESLTVSTVAMPSTSHSARRGPATAVPGSGRLARLPRGLRAAVRRLLLVRDAPGGELGEGVLGEGGEVG